MAGVSSYQIKQTLEESEGAIKNGQSKRNWQHCAHETQDEEKQAKNTTQRTKDYINILSTRHSREPKLFIMYGKLLFDEFRT
jgi:hypothetical protein